MQLENNYDIKKGEIPFKIQEFADSIEQIFGVAARLVELYIIKSLHARCKGYVYRSLGGNFQFADYVLGLKQFLKS